MIGVGCALILAGLAVSLFRVISLVRAARRVGIASMADVQEVIGRVQRLEPRLRELERNQTALAESLHSLSTKTAQLRYLVDELDRATGHLTSLKS